MIDPNKSQLEKITPDSPVYRYRVTHAGGSLEVRAHYCLSPHSLFNDSAKWKFELLSSQTMAAEYVALFDAGAIGVEWVNALETLCPNNPSDKVPPLNIRPHLNRGGGH